VDKFRKANAIASGAPQEGLPPTNIKRIALPNRENTRGLPGAGKVGEEAFGLPGEPIEELQEGLFSNTPGAQGVELDKNAINLSQ